MDFTVRQSTAKGKEDFVNLYARIRHKGQNTKYSLGFTIKRKEWERIRTLSYVGGNLMTSVGIRYADFAEILSKIKVAIERHSVDDTDIPALIRSIKAEVHTGDGLFVPEPTHGKMLLTEWMEKYINDLETGKRHKQHTTRMTSRSHVLNLKSCLTLVKSFEEVRCTKITLDGVTMAFQKAFVSYLENRGLKPNTINTRMGSIRLFARAAYIEKLTTANDFMNPEFVPAKEEVDNVFLTPERIEQLRNADLSSVEAVKALYKKAKFGKKRLAELPTVETRTVNSFQKVRDIFVVGCLTGQRYSDYSRMGTGMYIELKDKTFIMLRQIKTGAKVLVPLDGRVNEIFEKYPGGKLPTISRPIFQSYLKLLGELMGWTEKPIFDRHDEGNDADNKRFCDMLGSHTARRSFATNAYAAGIPLSSIMAITGHTTEKNLHRYLKLDAEDKALIAADDFKDFIQGHKEDYQGDSDSDHQDDIEEQDNCD